jgi:hypothetical protein
MAIAEYLIPCKTKNPLNGNREHWTKVSATRKKQKKMAWALTPRRMRAPCIVHMTRLGVRVMDDDNLGASLKSIRDGIAQALGIDDGDTTAARWEYAQARCKRGEEGVRVRISNGKDLPT